MAGRADDERCVDGVGVHAGLVVVVHADEGPVGDDAGNAKFLTCGGRTGDEVFDGCCVEELDVGEAEDLGEKSRGEESGVLDNDVGAFVFVGDAEIAKEDVARFAHHHGAEELAAEPGSSA